MDFLPLDEFRVAEPDLASYDWLVANISGGKDSQVMLAVLVEAATAAGVRDRLVSVFCDLGDGDEWPGTLELAAEHAAFYSLHHEVVRREVVNGDGERVPQSLSEHIEARGMWPDNARRYCTSDMKRAPVHRLLTRLAAETRTGDPGRKARILNVMGMRAEESPKRATMPAFANDERATNQTVRHVDTWLPIHGWTVGQVWGRIAAEGTRPHAAYANGMPRLSCRFCVLASKSALVRAAQLDPEGALRRAELEERMGHAFKKDLSMRDIIAAADAAGGPVAVDNWAA